MMASQEELPTSLPHFGQGSDTDWRKLFFKPIEVRRRPCRLSISSSRSSPLHALRLPKLSRPGMATKPRRPAAMRIRRLPVLSELNVDALLDLTDGGLTSKSPDDSSSRANDGSERADYSWNLRAVFGAVVAVGGYHLAIREPDRSSGRGVPRWSGAERPTKRKSGFPSW